MHPDDRAALLAIHDEVVLGGHVVTATCRVPALRRTIPADGCPHRTARRPRQPHHRHPRRAARRLRTRGSPCRSPSRSSPGRKREAIAVLRQADTTKDALLLAVAHDLRTPVAAAAGLAEILLEKHGQLSDSETHRIAEGLASSTGQLHAVLTNLLDVERVVGGHIAVRRRPTDLTALVATSAATAGLSNATVDLPANPIVADIDPGLTTPIIDNLLTNAARHAPPGTVVHVSLTPSADGVLLVINDEIPRRPRQPQKHHLRGLPTPTRSHRRRPRPRPVPRAPLRRTTRWTGLGRETAPTAAPFRVLFPPHIETRPHPHEPVYLNPSISGVDDKASRLGGEEQTRLASASSTGAPRSVSGARSLWNSPRS